MKSKKIYVLFLGLLALLFSCGNDVATAPTPPPDDTPEPDEETVEVTGTIVGMKKYDPPYHVCEYIYTDKWKMRGDEGGLYLMYVTQESEIIQRKEIKVGTHVQVELEPKKQKKPSRKYYIVKAEKLS